MLSGMVPLETQHLEDSETHPTGPGSGMTRAGVPPGVQATQPGWLTQHHSHSQPVFPSVCQRRNLVRSFTFILPTELSAGSTGAFHASDCQLRLPFLSPKYTRKALHSLTVLQGDGQMDNQKGLREEQRKI